MQPSASMRDLTKANDADNFLKESPTQGISQIEFLIQSQLVELSDKTYALNRYASLIRGNDIVHHYALEKFTRMLCVYIFQTHDYTVCANIHANLENYFPFYIGIRERPPWLKTYITEHNIPAAINEMFKRTSYQVFISLWGNSYLNVSAFPIGNIRAHLNTLANSTFYSTHDNAALHVLNTLSTGTGSLMSRVPGLSFLTTTVQSIAQNVSLPLTINTNRRATLLGYEKSIETIATPTPEHIELLFFLYMGGNDKMRENIVSHIDKLIINNSLDHDFLLRVLKTIAPEPLGLGWHGVKNPPDLLQHLSVASNKLLLCAAFHTCNEIERGDFQKIIEACTDKKTGQFTFTMTFSGSTTPATEWYAYLLCMGNFPTVTDGTIYCEQLTHRQYRLLLTLMESKKLTLSTSTAFDLAPAAYTAPQCRFEILCGQTVTVSGGMIQRAFSRGVRYLHIQLVNQPLQNILDILSDVSPYTANRYPGVVRYSFRPTNEKNDTSVDIELSALCVMPPSNITLSYAPRERLRTLLLEAYSSFWREILMNIDPGGQKPTKVRPIAIPLTALNDRDICQCIENHLYLQLFVFKEVDGVKIYLFDIELRPNGTNISTIQPGKFIATVAERDYAKSLFPTMRISEAVQRPYTPLQSLPSGSPLNTHTPQTRFS